MSARAQRFVGNLIVALILIGVGGVMGIMTSFTVSALKSTYGAMRPPMVTTITTTSPCAMSMRAARYEDDLCAAWIGPRGRVHVGPLSDAPARAHQVGE